MNHKMSVLIVEDDKTTNDVLYHMAAGEGCIVKQCFSGFDGLRLLESWKPGLILLDLRLPDLDGMEIIRRIRAFSAIPIIVISAISNETSKVEALDLGADDYICKPFGHSELLARMRTAFRHSMRRQQGLAPSSTYRVGDLFIDFEHHEIYKGDKPLRLTPIEFKLITLLAHNSGKVLTNAAIMTNIWGPYVTPDNGIIRVNIANIRRKIETNPADPQYIFTEIGIGYRMVEE
ncbi:MAG: response regulator transcription factor [Lachnospiraceae bacterium]|nr:response regulator transcription factor [Lachnospiraceae bacterium]